MKSTTRVALQTHSRDDVAMGIVGALWRAPKNRRSITEAVGGADDRCIQENTTVEVISAGVMFT